MLFLRFFYFLFSFNYSQQDATIFLLFISKKLYMFRAEEPPEPCRAF